MILSPVPSVEAPRNCPLCPRLAIFREGLRDVHPTWWNAPVPHFGDPEAWLAVVGLAPGKGGANRTGRPFTGDHAGLLLYETLLAYGLATGEYRERPDDGLALVGTVIVNSVKCVPPENKPTPAEIATCSAAFFRPALDLLGSVRVLVALGRIAHDAAVRAAGGRLAAFRFAHGAEHRLPDGRVLIDSYHCSRYNQNTNRLTREMFEQVFGRVLAIGAEQRSGRSC